MEPCSLLAADGWMITSGLDRLLGQADPLRGRPYGLLAHSAAVTGDLRPAVAALRASAGGPPRRLFAPEHGFWGVEQDMVPTPHRVDPLFGVETVSLYGSCEDSLRPPPGAFDDLDVLLVDLQDVGARYYTYAATAIWTSEAALARGVEVWVLDRPNPLGGDTIEGNLRQDGFESFVGAFRLPVRHGLTLGELCALEARRRGWDESGLRIVALEGWRREVPRRAGEGWRWRAPSPNMPTPESAWLYPGSCLVEATELSEGRGTTRPFELIGAPGLDGRELARRMQARQLPGVAYLPVQFRPQFQKHAGRLCSGIEIVVTDPLRFPSYRAGVELLVTLHGMATDVFRWRVKPYEFVSDRPAIDLLTGGERFRHLLEAGGDVEEWIAAWTHDEEEFREERDPVLLYR